ncbi:MAG: ATP synthase F1 subunit gamma, partial [Spirochaetota bacterium]
REIKLRIHSVSSTRKITKSMEMVSTVKMKKMQTRLHLSKPYSEKVEEIIDHLLEGGIDLNLDLLKKRENPKNSLIVLIAGNRGLCGGFNTSIAETALDFRDELLKKGRTNVQLYAFGKKAVNYLKFLKEPLFRSGVNPDDKLSFGFASDLGSELVELFSSGKFDEIYIASMRVKSASSQRPAVVQLLPIIKEESAAKEKHAGGDYLFDPDPDMIMGELVPLYIRVKIFNSFLESGFSEQFQRRVSMKNANDSAADMVRTLTVTYNRVRQAKITNEITEIVGGAAALD